MARLEGSILIHCSIVFVHGFNGHPKNTWLHDPSHFYWPFELHNLINEARIMAFGYDSNIRFLAAKNLMGIHDHAVNLLARLRNERATSPVREMRFDTTVTDSLINR